MKVIIKIFFPLILAFSIIIGCDSDQIIGESTYDGAAYLRFYLVTDSNGDIVDEGIIQNGQIPTSEYTHNSIKNINIPVAITYPEIADNITADYAITASGDFSDYTISPEQLSFGPDNIIDTITISFNERWSSEENSIDFELTQCSDPNVHIGQLNNIVQNNTLKVNLGSVYTTSTFSTNRLEIKGEAGEQIEFEVLFDNGFLPSEINDYTLFNEIKGFEYSLEKVIDDNNESITYIMTLSNDIQNDEVSYTTTLSLNEDSPYAPTGNTTLQIVKPLNIARDNAIYTSANFYNLNDPYYRTYGENWLWNSSNEACGWQAFNAFTYPVVVDKDDDNAILYSDNGTEDESDDIYHHAFRIGFNTNNAGRTTNAFNLKRWFNNESTDEDVSPGFNIPEALEFYPKDGISETEGTVLVIPQIITVSSKEGNSHNISISGEGTYAEISSGLFEITLEFRATNVELFGGTQVSYYKIYNSNSYGGDPEAIDYGCVEPVDL